MTPETSALAMVTELGATLRPAAPVPPTVTVVVCTYTERRWPELAAAVRSLGEQRHRPDQCVVVVDHNEGLRARCRAYFPGEVEVVANEGVRGLADARNTGVRRARGDVVAFLDDDASADPGWLGALVEHFADPAVAGVGGLVCPVWPDDRRPAWFPPEFDWVVGCSHRGLPETAGAVRNPIGASMSLRRGIFDAVVGFDTGLGRVGTVPLGCEDTELAVRARQHLPGIVFLHVPESVVRHRVSPDRVRLRYFVRRCYAEGLSKAGVAERAGTADGLSAERRYVVVTLPRGVGRGLLDTVRGDVGGLARSAVIALGLAVTAVGYAVAALAVPALETCRSRLGRRRRG